MSMCMYVCMYVCMTACVYVYTCICMLWYVCTCVYVVCVCVYVCAYPDADENGEQRKFSTLASEHAKYYSHFERQIDFLFFKIWFAFVWKADLWKGEGEESFIYWVTPLTSTIGGAEPIWSQEPGASLKFPLWVQGPTDLSCPPLP